MKCEPSEDDPFSFEGKYSILLYTGQLILGTVILKKAVEFCTCVTIKILFLYLKLKLDNKILPRGKVL